MYVEKFIFDTNYGVQSGVVQFTFNHATKADKKRKLKLKISNASSTDDKSV